MESVTELSIGRWKSAKSHKVLHRRIGGFIIADRKTFNYRINYQTNISNFIYFFYLQLFMKRFRVKPYKYQTSIIVVSFSSEFDNDILYKNIKTNMKMSVSEMLN